MNRYLPTGNEMISLPKINENTAGIEDFTYLSMAHKGLIEVRGGENTPLIVPFSRLTERKFCLQTSTGAGRIIGFLYFLPKPAVTIFP